ncbi:Dolichyl-phosphate-mannose-protein mannosyltransferase [compost metagenome]
MGKYVKPALCILLVCFPLLYNLDALAIRMWDEARLAQNATQMYENGNVWVTYCYHVPDMWNTKPPLLIWLQVCFMHITGINEWAIRLPAALAVLATFIFIFRQVKSQTRSALQAMFTVAVLVTTKGYIDLHVARTGDYEALLILWTTIGGLSLWKYSEAGKLSSLYTASIAFALAVFTKGVAGLMFIPAICIYLCMTQQLFPLLQSRHFYFAAALFLLIALLPYLMREHFNPGYLHAVMDNELGGRFLEVKENNGGPWYYYLNLLAGRDYIFWFVFIPVGIWLGIKERYKVSGRLAIYSGLMGFFFLITISISRTKLSWYDAPVYPYLAIVSAFAIHKLILLSKKISIRFYKNTLRFFLILFMIAYGILIRDIIWLNDAKYTQANTYNIGKYIKDKLIHRDQIKALVIYDNDCSPQVNFYMHMAEVKGYKTILANDTTDLSGKIVITQKPGNTKKLLARYHVRKIDEYFGALVWHCISGKSAP